MGFPAQASILLLLFVGLTLGLRLEADVAIVEDGVQEDAPDKEQEAGPSVVVITVPGRALSEERMQRLRPRLKLLGLETFVVEGPNMETYCPANVKNLTEDKEAGKRLLQQEWHGRIPDMKTYDLRLYEIATLVGHMRAWKHIAETGPAVILEDDADITSTDALKKALGAEKANVVLLDRRHCAGTEKAIAAAPGRKPPKLDGGDAGLSGYWLDSKAASALLEHFPLNSPVDWGVNTIFNTQVHAICPGTYPVAEHGGELFARKHSMTHGCAGMPDTASQHPVALFFMAQVHHGSEASKPF